MAKVNGALLVGETTGGRIGLREKVALGAVTLGCAAMLAFGGIQAGEMARSRPQVAAPAAQQAAGGLDWEQVERSQVAPALPAAILSFEEQRFWEQNTQVPADTLPTVPLDWEQVERGQVAPSLPATILDWEQAERTHVAP